MADALLGFGEIIVYLVCIPIYVFVLTVELLSAPCGGCARKRHAHPKSVLITGGGSGIGRALALEYARRGTSTLTLLDVSAPALLSVAAAVREAGCANVRTAVVDVCDVTATAAAVAAAEAAAPLDCVHANAGLAESSLGLDAFLDLERAAQRLTAVNVNGVVNTVLPAIAAMRGRGRGQIVITASLAGLTTFIPAIPSYAASKNWARAWALGLRAHFWTTGLRVSCLCPGFIDTPMTQSVPTHANGVSTNRAYPGLVTAEWAARCFIDGIAADKAVVTFPVGLFLFNSALFRAPLPFSDFLLRNTPIALGALWGPTNPKLVSPTPASTSSPAPARGRSASNARSPRAASSGKRK